MAARAVRLSGKVWPLGFSHRLKEKRSTSAGVAVFAVPRLPCKMEPGSRSWAGIIMPQSYQIMGKRPHCEGCMLGAEGQPQALHYCFPFGPWFENCSGNPLPRKGV